MDILKLAEGYSQAVVATVAAGEKFGKALVELLKPIIPDLRFSIGWQDGGMEGLFLWSESRHVDAIPEEGPFSVALDAVLGACFRDAVAWPAYIDCPFGVYVTEDEAKRIGTIIKGAKDADRRG